MDNNDKKEMMEEIKIEIPEEKKEDSKLEIESIKLKRLEYAFYASLFGCISAFITFLQDLFSYFFPKAVTEKSLITSVDTTYIIYSTLVFVIFLSLSITLYNLKQKNEFSEK